MYANVNAGIARTGVDDLTAVSIDVVGRRHAKNVHEHETEEQQHLKANDQELREDDRRSPREPLRSDLLIRTVRSRVTESRRQTLVHGVNLPERRQLHVVMKASPRQGMTTICAF